MASFVATAIYLLATATLGIFAEPVAVKCSGDCAATWSSCGNETGFKKCCASDDVCMFRTPQYSQCRPKGQAPKWPSSKALKCGGTKGPFDVKVGASRAPPTAPARSGGGPPSFVDEVEVTGGYLPNTGMGGTPASRCPATVVPTFKPCCTPYGEGVIALRCAKGSICTRKNAFYGACATPERRADVIATQGWEGTTLECGEDMSKGCMNTKCEPE